PSPDGRALSLYDDPAQSAAEIAKFSLRDAERFPELHRVLGRMAGVLHRLLTKTPPNLDKPGSGDLWNLLQAGRAFRALGSKDMFRRLRWPPMAVADLTAEWFETDLLRAIVAARGVFGTFLGPWSAGSACVLLLRAAADPHPAGAARFARGGVGSLTQAM